MKYFSQIPATVADLSVLGEEMDDGLTKLGQTLDIKQVTATQMDAATGAMEDADDAFNASRSAQQTAYDNFHTADDALTVWLGKVTGALSTHFGKRWNRRWVQAGFITPSIRVPKTVSDRLALALRVISFLTANPSYEAANQGVTAAIGTTLRGNATTTQGLATAADVELSQKGTVRDGAIAALTSLMRMLIGVLGEILNADDPRWLTFGLQMPAKLVTPAAPTGLAVVTSPIQDAAAAAGPNLTTILVTCDATPFATRYRFRLRMADLLGSSYQLVASTKEPMAQINIPANATVEIIAQAVNGNRQSLASEAVVYQPVAKKADATVPATASEVAAKVAAGETSATAAKRSSNGHGNGTRLPALK